MHQIIAKAVAEGRNLLEPEALRVFTDYGLPVPPFRFVKTREEAAQASNDIGYPVVMKIVSPDVLHKSDMGGVKINLNSDHEVEDAFEEIMNNVKRKTRGATIKGALIGEHVPKGLECIVGMIRDPEFGPALMFGIGGVFVELLKDVSFSVLPMTLEDAEEMVTEIRGHELLKGLRGEPPKDISAIVDFLMKTAKLIEQNPEIKEIDINPVSVFEKGVMALDGRVILQ